MPSPKIGCSRSTASTTVARTSSSEFPSAQSSNPASVAPRKSPTCNAGRQGALRRSLAHSRQAASPGRYQFHSAYTFSKALNYANYDQVPFGYAPVDPTNLRREYGPAPNDQRHRLVLEGSADLPLGLRLSPLWTYASGVPMNVSSQATAVATASPNSDATPVAASSTPAPNSTLS